MREILFLAHRIPWPPNRGDKIRSHHIVRALAELAPVHVGCFAESAEERAFEAELRQFVATVHVEMRTKPRWRAGVEALATRRPVSLRAFASAPLSGWVEQVLASRPIGAIFVFSGQMAQFVPAGWTGRWVMDFGDVDSAKFESYAQNAAWPMRRVAAREARLLARFEQEIAVRASVSTFVSAAEAELFRRRSALSAAKVEVLENGIDHRFFDPASPDIEPPAERIAGPLIAFTGQMDYPPNIEAAQSFASEVFPAICERFPAARFAIVGRAPVPAVRRLAERPGIIVTGEVADVRSWLAAADIVAAPLRTARGIQNKVLEAMAMARPVVASRAAAEGIDARDGEHLRVASSPGEEARLIADLLADPEGAREIGRAARAHVECRYDWQSQLAPLARLIGHDHPAEIRQTEAEAAA